MKFLILLFTSGLLMVNFAQAKVPVEPHHNQVELLSSNDGVLTKNKRLVFDFYRIVLSGWRISEVDRFLSDGYIQHNPNVETGKSGFVEFLQSIARGRVRPVPTELAGLVSIQAERDMVTLSFVRRLTDQNGEQYTSTWFDMFRVQNDKIVEHWDNDIKR